MTLPEYLPQLQQLANALMGIKTISNIVSKNTFSKDILKIEKCSLNEDYLTIIDVPSIFCTTTEGITINKDKGLVKDIVKSNVDVATQEILALTEEADPARDRTLGILTKANLVTEQTARLTVVNLVEGNQKSLKLSYYVSISALREQLEELLGEITDCAFPELRSETRQKLANAEKKLKDLGYLVGIASNFQALVCAALNADYLAHRAFDRNALRLITAVVNTTEQFNTDFDKFARKYLFEAETQVASEAPVEVIDPPSPVSASPVPASPLFYEEEEDDEREKEDEENSSIIQLDTFDIPTPGAFPDLDSIITTDWFIELPKEGIMEWIAAVHRHSRGLELGSLGHGVLPSVFREQSAKWEKIAKQYLSKIILLVHRFILTALELVCADTQVLQNVSSAILDDLCAKYEGSIDQAILLVNVERDLKPYTLNHYFNHNQQKSYGSRIMETLRPKARSDTSGMCTRLVVDLSDVPDAVTNKSNAAHATETIHDTLEAYYKVAHKRFVDNVFSQAVDYKLLSGPESPLQLFSDQWVLSLDPEKLLVLVGESRRTRERRERLKKEIQDLEVAMEILR
ncbi:hypothetical protein LX36DRAFT_684021 [Colletotrichum falcatum]|nr:hypothetical protein LX36DRAFT_684021 [Colletotrichum falcatum]